ncbi:MAG: quinone-dependent dihydroorotate dehydrogenase [Candidatus Saccharimonadales bacterium]|jgi:dihydroorotate dehydrogenase
MIRLFSTVTAFGYARIIKPLLFRSHPDIVHSRLLKLSHLRQKLGCTDRIVNTFWAYHNSEMLGQTIDTIYFSNPIGLSAGFDKNVELVPTMKAIGYGFMTGGSVTFYPCAGNPRPWFHRLPAHKSLIVHVGLANEGVRKAISRIRSYRNSTFSGFPLVVSVAKTNNPENCNDEEAIADYIGSLQLLKDETRASVLEINISCPNTYGGEPFTTPARLEKLLAALDALEIQKPVWVKMPINHAWPDFEALLQVILNHNVQGVTIGNLSKDRSKISSEKLPSTVKGNLSGLPTQKLSDELIRQTYRAYGNRLTIIGVGGVFSAEDAYRKICLGASLVALITGMIFEGPQLIGQLNRELTTLLRQDGHATLESAVGSKNEIVH